MATTTISGIDKPVQLVQSVDAAGAVIGGTGTSASQTQGAAADNAAAVGNPVLAGGIHETTPGTYANLDVGNLHIDTRGNLRVTLASTNGVTAVAVTTPSTEGAASAAGLETTTQGLTFNGSTWDRDRKPSSVSRILSAAADTNATSAKASAGDVFSIYGHNANAAARYLKFYNKASAPTVGTDTPVLTLHLAASSPFKFEFAKGCYFSTGIAYALTTGVADADTGALTAADILALNVVYA